MHLREIDYRDRDEFLALVRESRALHHPWAYPPERGDQFDELVARARREDVVTLLGCRDEDDAIFGVFTISQIVRGAFQSAYLGYYGHAEHAGQGYMRAALELVLDHAFGAARAAPHRGQHPAGQRAVVALARGAGFRLEGFSPRYLLIGGRWRDHERYAITAEDRPERVRTGLAGPVGLVRAPPGLAAAPATEAGGRVRLRRGGASSAGMLREVRPQGVQQRARVERGRRVVERQQAHGARPDHADLGPAVQPGDAGVGSPRSSLVAKFPSVQTTSGCDELELARTASAWQLAISRGQRLAVAGRPALQAGGQVRRRSRDRPMPAEQLVEQLAGRAEERPALLVLDAAGRLAHEHQVRAGIARRRPRPGCGVAASW